jgi:hypothetical protein
MKKDKMKITQIIKIMRRIFFALITISLVFISCKKENPDDENIVGGVFNVYTATMVNPFDFTINISDSIYRFNQIEASYYSHKPISNQNIFRITLYDPAFPNYICIGIFTPDIKPEKFFIKTPIKTDSININLNGISENFYNADATFGWDTVSFDGFSFKGKAYLVISEKFVGTTNSNTYYPIQKLNFEIK